MRLYTIHSSDGVSTLAPYPRKLQCSTRGAELVAEMKKSEEQDWFVTPSSGNSSIQIPLSTPAIQQIRAGSTVMEYQPTPDFVRPAPIPVCIHIYIYIYTSSLLSAPRRRLIALTSSSVGPLHVNTHLMTSIEANLGTDDDPRLAIFKELYVKSESWKDFLKRVNLRQTLEHSDRKSCADIRSPRIRHQCCAVLP